MPTMHERHPAIVTKVDDPLKRGRIKVKCFGLTGDGDVEYPEWIDAVHDWSIFTVPDVGEEVEIEAIVQDDEQEDARFQAFLEEPRVRWRGKRFVSSEGDQPRPPHPLFTSKNYGKRRGMGTPAGHVLLFDDTAGDEQVLLAVKLPGKAPSGADGYSYLSFDKAGSALLINARGSMVRLNAEQHQIAIIDENGNSITTDAGGVRAIDTHGNSIELKDGGITILATGAVTVQASGAVSVSAANAQIEASEVKVVADTIELGDGADSPVARFTELKTAFDAHTHPTAFGPSGPPTAPLDSGVGASTTTVK